MSIRRGEGASGRSDDGEFEKIESAATAEGIPIAPAAALTLGAARVPLERSLIDARVVMICTWSIVLALITGFIAQALMGIIGLVTNIAFYGRFSKNSYRPLTTTADGWCCSFRRSAASSSESWRATDRRPSADRASRKRWSRSF